MSLDEHDRLTRTRAFFGVRAAGWDGKFGSDEPVFAAAVSEAGIPEGAAVADLGCGTGRALPILRDRIGPGATLLGIDVTPEMLQVARPRAEQARAGLVLADAVTLPLAGGCLDAIFAAGLLSHLPDPLLALSELARVSREHAVLVLFHPIGRAALARKHGRELTAEDTQAEPVLTDLLARSGWHLDGYDDGAGRFLAVARRRTDTGPDRAATAAGQAHQHG